MPTWTFKKWAICALVMVAIFYALYTLFYIILTARIH